MPPINTFVFFDFGTLRNQDLDTCDSVTDLCLQAIPRQQYLEPTNTNAPRNGKIYLKFPTHRIRIEDFNVINNFINKQEKPVCLFAHNGNRFDFAIMKRHFENINVSLADDVLVADSMYAFYDILEDRRQGEAVREIYFKGYPTPADAYTLHDVYRRVVTYHPVAVKPHVTENDVYMLFRISHALGQRFLDWADNEPRQRRFAQVQSTRCNVQKP
ncbi:unnamed protein product [Spodoptera exigua]|nr:unnamed protein product [Spodoptera exigua]